MTPPPAARADLARYVPRVAVEWDLHAAGRRVRSIDATLCLVDISGFTTLSERLARRGRIGAEELTEVLDRVFGGMLELAYARGGSLLKFGGDALLLLFEGPDHPLQATSAAVEMRAELRKAASIPTSVGRVPLRMSTGLHSGWADLYRAGSRHQELVVTGPCASLTAQMEATADAGEIVVSSAVRDRIGPESAPQPKGNGWLLRWRSPRVAACGPTRVATTAPAEAILPWIPVALRPHLGGPRDAEHRIGSVAFVEFVGTDALIGRDGPAAIADRLHDLVSLVQEAAFTEGVTFLGSDVDADGGKLILASGVPLTQHDDEGRMLRTIRTILDGDLPIAVRVGVNRGHVFAGEIGTPFRATYTVMGDTVNLAARLMSSAPVGSAYVAPSVVERSRTIFATVALPPMTVKGKTDPVAACDLGDELGDRPETHTSILPFTGRDRELAWLRERLSPQSGRRRPAIAVVGEAGIGKTRLLWEAVGTMRDRHVLDIRAEPYGTATPFRAMRDTIRTLLGVERADQATMAETLVKRVTAADPDLEPLAPLIGDVAHIDVSETEATAAIEAKFRRDRIADTLVALLDRIVDGPLVVIADDAHWLDTASAAVLDRIAQAAGRRPWSLVVCRRPGADGFTPNQADVLVLEPLAPNDTARVIDAATATTPLLPHDAETLARRSAGIPLYIEEMVKLVRESGRVGDLPESIDGVVGTKIDSLPGLARTVLRHAAVLGRSFRLSVLQEILVDQEAVLDTATGQQLADFLEQDGADRFRFRHSLARDVAYEGLSYRARRELHLRAGEVIEAMAGDDAAAAADNLAIHFTIGGNAVKGWEYARVAGDRALAVYANVEAAEQYERALAAGRRLDTVTARDRAKVLIKIGDARERAGMFDAALVAYRRAHSLVRDPVTRARLLEKRARVYERTGAFPAALSSLTRGTRLLDRCDDPAAPAIRAELLSFAATVRQAQQRPEAARRKAIEAAAAADAADAKRAAARARSVLGSTSLLLGNPAEALEAWQSALTLYRELDDLSGEAAITANLGVEAYYDGDWDRAVELYERGREAALQAGNVVDAAVAGSNIGEVLVHQGRAEEAEPVLRDAARVLRTTGLIDGAIVAETYLARLLVDEGRRDEAAPVLHQIEEDAAALGLPGTTYEASIIRARILVATGSPGAALDLLSAGAASAPDHYRTFLAPTAAAVEAEARAALGDVEGAVAALAAGRSTAREGGLSYEDGVLELTAARITGTAPAPEAVRALRALGVRRVAGTDLAVAHRGRIS